METGLHPHWSEAVRAWAVREPLVVEIHAFGSRIKGGYTPESDLDLALVVDGGDDGERLGNAIFLMEGWRSRLQEVIPVEVHVQAMFDDDEVVGPAVREHGVEIYRRSSPRGDRPEMP